MCMQNTILFILREGLSGECAGMREEIICLFRQNGDFMIKIYKADKKDLEKVLEARYRTAKEVFGLGEDYVFSAEFRKNTRQYLKEADQTTVIAVAGEEVIGCATICYIRLLPTLEHPTGKRAHIMNVYTDVQYRRCGIAFQMMSLLIEEAKKKGVTEITLDATEEGRILYEKCGFLPSEEGMVLKLKDSH